MSSGKEHVCRRLGARIAEQKSSFCQRGRERRQQFLEEQHAADRAENIETLRRVFEEEGTLPSSAGGSKVAPCPPLHEVGSSGRADKQKDNSSADLLHPRGSEDEEVVCEEEEVVCEEEEVVCEEEEDVFDEEEQSVKPSAGFYSKQLIICDWIVGENLPSDLGTEWMVYLRPEGKRCLVVSSRGSVKVRDKCGALMREVPGTQKAAMARFLNNGLTVFECVMVQDRILGDTYMAATELLPKGSSSEGNADQGDGFLFWICDVLWWNGISLCDSSMECRRFFLESRLQECRDVAATEEQVGMHDRCPFRLVDCQPCNIDFIHKLYHGVFPFGTESLMFVHKEAHYLPGFNPLWLCWKDQHISQFCIDTAIPKKGGGDLVNRQLACLEVVDNGALVTADDITVSHVIAEEMNKRAMKAGDVVRVDFVSIHPRMEETSGESSMCLEDMRVMTLKHHRSKLRRPPDPLNRILFQYHHRAAADAEDTNNIDGVVSFEALVSSIGM
eukprot:GHVS01068070.1.p1 GENE.GHVS01068070.1~~GHVS01068070.1.p1  ORF type:complete len:501 (+),score=98.29 GHVS01068070.1:1217-2719(+)